MAVVCYCRQHCSDAGGSDQPKRIPGTDGQSSEVSPMIFGSEDHAEPSDVNQAPKARYPIQIATAQLQDGDIALFVLANDHTVWELDYTVDGNYRPLPQLPHQKFHQ